MFFYIAGAIFLTIQTAIVWRVFRNGKHLAKTNELLGEIKMKQDDFDKKVTALAEQVTGLDTKLDGESSEIAELVSDYKAEIQRLKDAQGDNIDTSGLDALSDRLNAVGTRIGGLVDPSPATGESSPPVEVPTDNSATNGQTADVPPSKVENDESSSDIPASADEN